jgi:hypothetical protein
VIVNLTEYKQKKELQEIIQKKRFEISQLQAKLDVLQKQHYQNQLSPK